MSSGNRRLLIAVVAVLGVGAAFWGWQASLTNGRVPVIIYLVDTLRADRLGAYKYFDRSTSPIIDALAKESVVFEQAYAPAPWTPPSVASLITSTYLCEHGVLSERHQLGAGQETLAQKLDTLGYDTLGRYANVWVGPISGLDRGFRNLVETPDDWGEMGTQVSAMLDEIDTDRPFFLYVHTVEPHDPFKAPQGAIKKFGEVPMADQDAYFEAYKSFNKATGADWTAKRPPGTTDKSAEIEASAGILSGLRDAINLMYDAAILTADRTFGTLLLDLIDRNILDRSIVIFVSDHGEEFEEHESWFHQQSVYEELIRVPLIVRFPGGEFGGKRVKAPVSLIDVMPTILDYIDANELCEDCRGRSLLPMVSGLEDGAVERPTVFSLRHDVRLFNPAWAEARGNINVALRQGDWKGIWNKELNQVELYDLANDPEETNDLSADHPELVAAFAAEGERWLTNCSAQSSGEASDQELDPETEEKLRSLGYL